jgi:hypothetical protein
MIPQHIPEVNVLIATTIWLHNEGWSIEKLSTASGTGIDYIDSKNTIKSELLKIGIDAKGIEFVHNGEDIRAKKDNTIWRIECKGLAETMKPETTRNQFDRAIASAVSYYNQTQGIRLGLALPEQYRQNIKNRLPSALRSAINLWVLLYISADNYVLPLPPQDEFPF